MPKTQVALVLTVFVAVLFAGCVDDEKPAPAPATDVDAPEATPTSELGSVKGLIVSASLEEVKGATVFLTKDGDLKGDALTDAKGRFTVNGLEPGKYIVQVSAVGFNDAAKGIDVAANKITQVDMQIEPLTQDQLGVPYTVPDSWTGFIGCGVGSVAVNWATCSTLEDTPVADPREDFHHEFNFSAGPRSIAFGMVWDGAGGIAGKELSLSIENAGCDVLCTSSRTYATLEGTSPLIVIIDAEDTIGKVTEFDNMTGPSNWQFRVFTGGAANVAYQQAFTIHWEAFYHEAAPEGYSPIPDA